MLYEEFLIYLKGLARNYMLKRYISIAKKDDLGIVITDYFNNFSPKKNHNNSISTVSIELNSLLDSLNYQNIRSFVFNYLDYLIWDNCDVSSTINNKFKFTTQGSIEHFHPQNPINQDSDTQSKFEVHRFGNLCLIDSRLNSKVSNNMPIAKKEHYDLAFSTKVDSLKLYKMIETFKTEGNKWGKEQVIKHENEMLTLFEDALNLKIEGLEKNE